jgi:DNA helicase-2/ATP-dependent DNA helicase PcrA
VAVDQINPLLRGLTGPQREAVVSDAAPLCVLAGAGSGKTTVLTRRVARRLADRSAEPAHTLVVTFTRKASRELRGRLWRLDVPGPVWAGTFHAAAYGQLRRHWADTGTRPLAVVDDPRRLLRRVIDVPDLVAADTVRAVLAEIQWAQARLVTPEAYVAAALAAERRTPLALDEMAETYARYGEAKRTHGVIDLGDLLTSCAEILERDTAAAAAARWRIRHLFVDEFQDMNPAQFRLLRAWLGGRPDLFVVGDPRQAVYSWNGADPALLERLPDLLPGTTVLRLDANHRSSPQVIAAARAVLGSGEGEPGDRPDGPVPAVAGFDDDAEEAMAVARWLRVMHRPGRPWSHLAVLARTNARLAPVAAALRSTGIPFRVGSAPEAPAEIRAVIDLLGAGPRERRLRSALADLSLSGLSMADEGAGGGGRSGLPAGLLRLADEHAVEDPGATLGIVGGRSGRLCGGALHLPPGQGSRVAGRRPRRSGGRPGPHLLCHLARGPGRGAAPSLRGCHPRRGVPLVFLGPAAPGGREVVVVPAVAAARRPRGRRCRGRTHRPRGLRHPHRLPARPTAHLPARRRVTGRLTR